MNQGLNNQNAYMQQLTQSQAEEFQQLLRQQQFLNTIYNGNLTKSGLPNLFFPESQNRNQQPQDLFNFNLNLVDQQQQLNYMKLLQKTFQTNNSFLNPLLASQLLLNFNYLQVNQPKNNVPQKVITIDDDDEPSKVQRCHNPKCSNKGDKKIKTKKGEQILFCDKCVKLYNKGNFCDFCDQVYSNGAYEQDEQGWIQCDECEKWNHINCEAKFRNSNINQETENKTYYCLNCTKLLKKQQQQVQQKKQKIVEEFPKQRQEYEDYRTREKNINFVATKDNKIQFTFRLNLYDEEIKADLEALRNIGKKVKKSNDSPQLKSMSQNPQQQIQEDKNSDQQVNNTRSRTRNNKAKVNYRNLGGE